MVHPVDLNSGAPCFPIFTVTLVDALTCTVFKSNYLPILHGGELRQRCIRPVRVGVGETLFSLLWFFSAYNGVEFNELGFSCEIGRQWRSRTRIERVRDPQLP